MHVFIPTHIHIWLWFYRSLKKKITTNVYTRAFLVHTRTLGPYFIFLVQGSAACSVFYDWWVKWKYVGTDCRAACERVCVWTYTLIEQKSIRQEPRPCTSNPRHYLHRLFPACRVIPAPALPPLPSHTYQSPAAVPLPESGPSSLENLRKRQQPVLFAFFFLFLSHTLKVSYLFFAFLSIERFISLHFPQIPTYWIVYFPSFIFKTH